MNVETGEVEGGLVIMLLSYNTMNCPLVMPVAESGLVNLIRYPVPSSDTSVHGVVVVVSVLTPLLQLLVNTAVLTTTGLGTNRLTDPPISTSFSTFNLTV